MAQITHIEFWKVYDSRKAGPLGHYRYTMHVKVHRDDDEVPTLEPLLGVKRRAALGDDVRLILDEGRAAWREENPKSRGVPPWSCSGGGDFSIPKRGLRYRLGTLYPSGLFRRG